MAGSVNNRPACHPSQTVYMMGLGCRTESWQNVAGASEVSRPPTNLWLSPQQRRRQRSRQGGGRTARAHHGTAVSLEAGPQRWSMQCRTEQRLWVPRR